MTETSSKNQEYEDRIMRVIGLIAILGILAALIIFDYWIHDWLMFGAPKWLQVLLIIAGLIVIMSRIANLISKDEKVNAANEPQDPEKIHKP